MTPTGAGRRLAPPPSPSGVTAINVTPLIDVLLVLFVVYLVIVIFGRRTVPVTVPAEESAITAQIVLEITNTGNYSLNGQPIPAPMLAPILRAAFKDRPARLIFIRTAPERTYQDFITAADIARGAGASMVAMVGSVTD